MARKRLTVDVSCERMRAYFGYVEFFNFDDEDVQPVEDLRYQLGGHYGGQNDVAGDGPAQARLVHGTGKEKEQHNLWIHCLNDAMIT